MLIMHKIASGQELLQYEYTINVHNKINVGETIKLKGKFNFSKAM